MPWHEALFTAVLKINGIFPGLPRRCWETVAEMPRRLISQRLLSPGLAIPAGRMSAFATGCFFLQWKYRMDVTSDKCREGEKERWRGERESGKHTTGISPLCLPTI